jgi:hypothetical protein
MDAGSQEAPMVSAPAPQGDEFDRHLVAITEARGALEPLDRLPVGEHACRFEALHDALTGALSSIESV